MTQITVIQEFEGGNVKITYFFSVNYPNLTLESIETLARKTRRHKLRRAAFWTRHMDSDIPYSVSRSIAERAIQIAAGAMRFDPPLTIRKY